MYKHPTEDSLVTKYSQEEEHLHSCGNVFLKVIQNAAQHTPYQKTLAAVSYPISFRYALEKQKHHVEVSPLSPNKFWDAFVDISHRERNGKPSRFKCEKWFQDNTLSGFTFSNSSRTLLEAKT